MQHVALIRFSWVPGTLNRVRLQNQAHQAQSCEVSLSHLEKVLGRPATFDLYLKGHLSLTLGSDTLASLTETSFSIQA